MIAGAGMKWPKYFQDEARLSRFLAVSSGRGWWSACPSLVPMLSRVEQSVVGSIFTEDGRNIDVSRCPDDARTPAGWRLRRPAPWGGPRCMAGVGADVAAAIVLATRIVGFHVTTSLLIVLAPTPLPLATE